MRALDVPVVAAEEVLTDPESARTLTELVIPALFTTLSAGLLGIASGSKRYANVFPGVVITVPGQFMSDPVHPPNDRMFRKSQLLPFMTVFKTSCELMVAFAFPVWRNGDCELPLLAFAFNTLSTDTVLAPEDGATDTGCMVAAVGLNELRNDGSVTLPVCGAKKFTT